MAAVHCFEYVFATALHRNVNEFVNAFVCETIEQCFLIAEHMARVSHAESDAVIAVHVSKDSLREFGEVRADVKTVAGAVLAGQLYFEATVIDERLDLIDNRVWRKAVETALDEMRAAKGAGIEATFFDVHDANEWRFAKDVCGADAGLVASTVLVAFASAVLFCVTQIPPK